MGKSEIEISYYGFAIELLGKLSYYIALKTRDIKLEIAISNYVAAVNQVRINKTYSAILKIDAIQLVIKLVKAICRNRERINFSLYLI